MTSTDIKNTTNYEGDAIQVGVSLGMTENKPQANTNGLGYGTDRDSDSSITKGGVSGYNDPEGILTTENREPLGGKLNNVFNETRVNEELGAQTEITQAFDQERRKIKTELNKKEQDLREDAEDALKNGDNQIILNISICTPWSTLWLFQRVKTLIPLAHSLAFKFSLWHRTSESTWLVRHRYTSWNQE